MAKSSSQISELQEAARLLEEELEHFARLTHAIEKEPLSSRKSLDRAGGSLAKIADVEDRLAPAMGALMTALNALRARHEQQTGIVQRRAEEIRERSEVYRALMERLGTLVASTGEVNARLSELSASEKEKAELVSDLDGSLEQLRALTDSIEAFRAECKELRFEDIARQADALSTQLDNVHGKLARLRKQLSR